jgi:murein DD-endopeptidase MepM/ murein hydrolase activator NlpD
VQNLGGVVHDIFISYASDDKAVAEAICRRLEASGAMCWMAPRDLQGGETWAGGIDKAIQSSKAMVLVLSRHTGKSTWILKELTLATNIRIPVIPYRIENIVPEAALSLLIADLHWLDAFGGSGDSKLDALSDRVLSILGRPVTTPNTTTTPGTTRPNAPNPIVATQEHASHFDMFFGKPENPAPKPSISAAKSTSDPDAAQTQPPTVQLDAPFPFDPNLETRNFAPLKRLLVSVFIPLAVIAFLINYVGGTVKSAGEWEESKSSLAAVSSRVKEVGKKAAAIAGTPGEESGMNLDVNTLTPKQIDPLRLTHPVKGTITSGFGMRYHPILKLYRLHAGVDFTSAIGTPILAAADGKVINAGYLSGFGNAVVIDHGDGITTLYAHCSKILVTKGNRVIRGRRLGSVGATGEATGPVLHFEVHDHGKPVDPKKYWETP